MPPVASASPGSQPGQPVDRRRRQNAARDAVADTLSPLDEWLQVAGSQVDLEPVAGPERFERPMWLAGKVDHHFGGIGSELFES
ncbi:MAG TPA: hypothetical protein VED20_05960 [Streptosporangiaceae bacterium]|nr:hypothetical protein [Streptosporangiaceae bacterium]